MNTLFRAKQVDQTLERIQSLSVIPPTKGWLKTIRNGLGMSLETFGKRLGVTKATAHQIEQAEMNESITIKRLRAAADALECDLVIAVVPRKSLERQLRDRAYELAKADFARLNHSMLLEGQAVYDRQAERIIKESSEEIIEERDPRLWISS